MAQPQDNPSPPTADHVAQANRESLPPEHGAGHSRHIRVRHVILVMFLMAAALVTGVLFSGELGRAGLRVLEAVGGGNHESADTGEQWTCGMHPAVIRPGPGLCPICNMDLVPVSAARQDKDLVLDPLIVQSIGVRVRQVTQGPLKRSIRTVGSVAYDETLVRDVTLKFEGWVEKLYADSVGMRVEAGWPLLELYSPALYSAQVEYLEAFKSSQARPATAGGGFAEDTKWAGDLLATARKRLEYFDVSEDQVRQIERSGKVAKAMTISSPFDGIVVEKDVLNGQKVDAGARLFRIADLSRVWVMVTLYEDQLPYVSVGDKAAMSLTYVPGQKFEGKVAYIYPYINEQLRQVRLRLEFANPDGKLKPGMFANIELGSQLPGDRVLVPFEAIIDTGQRQRVLISRGEGRFEPRDVKVGVRDDSGNVEILEGLEPGDWVVTSGQFLLDSEANRREFFAKLSRGQLATDPAAAGPSKLDKLPDEAAALLSAMVDDYLAIHSAIFAAGQGNRKQVDLAGAAKSLGDRAGELGKTAIPGDEHFWHTHRELAEVAAKAGQLAKTADRAAARELLADMSAAFGKLLRATGVPPGLGKTIVEMHCPMVRKDTGGVVWLQEKGQAQNPYDETMPTCHDREVLLPVTGAKPDPTPSPQAQPAPGPSPMPPGHRH